MRGSLYCLAASFSSYKDETGGIFLAKKTSGGRFVKAEFLYKSGPSPFERGKCGKNPPLWGERIQKKKNADFYIGKKTIVKHPGEEKGRVGKKKRVGVAPGEEESFTARASKGQGGGAKV